MDLTEEETDRVLYLLANITDALESIARTNADIAHSLSLMSGQTKAEIYVRNEDDLKALVARRERELDELRKMHGVQ